MHIRGMGVEAKFGVLLLVWIVVAPLALFDLGIGPGVIKLRRSRSWLQRGHVFLLSTWTRCCSCLSRRRWISGHSSLFLRGSLIEC